MLWVYRKPESLMGARIKCYFCGKGVRILRFGNVTLAACCGQLIYFNKEEHLRSTLS